MTIKLMFVHIPARPKATRTFSTLKHSWKAAAYSPPLHFPEATPITVHAVMQPTLVPMPMQVRHRNLVPAMAWAEMVTGTRKREYTRHCLARTCRMRYITCLMAHMAMQVKTGGGGRKRRWAGALRMNRRCIQ